MDVWGPQEWQEIKEGLAIAYLIQSNDRTLRGKEVRLIDENNEKVGVMTFEAAVDRAQSVGQDLVMVAPKAEPPVCRIMDFGKFQYELSKKERDAKKKQSQQKLKEIKFHPNIDAHDYQTKMNHAIAFLKKGFKVKFSMFFRGREMAHMDLGVDLLKRASEDVSELGTADGAPRRAGRTFTVVVTPGGGRKV